MTFLDCNYRIDGFLPPAKNEEAMPFGRYGFNINLKKEFAKRALDKILPEKIYEMLQKAGKSIIENTGQILDATIAPYHFVKIENNNSFLIQFIDVPGDACNIGFDGNLLNKLNKELIIRENDKYLRYFDHNVDNLTQAYTLLSLFTFWHDFIEPHLQ